MLIRVWDLLGPYRRCPATRAYLRVIARAPETVRKALADRQLASE